MNLIFRLFVFCIVLNCSVLEIAEARRSGPETEAVYTVPTSPEFVPYSRFVIDIVEPFVGEQTQIISYRFPEILVGEPSRLIELTRVEGTENSWTSDVMDCHCTIVDGDNFSCNVYLKTAPASEARALVGLAAETGLSLEKSLSHLETMPLSETEKIAYRGVVRSFFSGEPAGIFTYEIR